MTDVPFSVLFHSDLRCVQTRGQCPSQQDFFWGAVLRPLQSYKKKLKSITGTVTHIFPRQQRRNASYIKGRHIPHLMPAELGTLHDTAFVPVLWEQEQENQ